ncbi:MAG: hypothetical protein H6718_04255 [Polyangiaceae bacterium]|nr:hypothetical protein [Polyangiaceae bacterium]
MSIKSSETSTSSVSINPGLALRLDPIEGGIRVTGSETLKVSGGFDELRKNLHAVLSAEIVRFIHAETRGLPKPLFPDGAPGPLTMAVHFTVFEDDTVELICRGLTRNGEHLAKSFKGHTSEHQRLDEFVRDICGAYLFEVFYDGDTDRYVAERKAAEIAEVQAKRTASKDDHATWKGLHLHIRCDASRYHVVASVHDRCHTTQVSLYDDTDARRPRQQVREDLIDWVTQVVASYDLEVQ